MKKTASAGGVVKNREGKILIVSQRGASWSLPKGHIEEGEGVLQASKREIQEESGLTDLTLIEDLGSYERFRVGRDGGEDRSELKTLHMFLYTTNESELKPIDPDNPEARWVDPEQVTDFLTHPKDKEFFLRVLPKIRKSI